MKLEIYNHLVAAQASGRTLLRGPAATGTLVLASGAALGALTRPARARDNFRAELLRIQGVGAGSPTDADWQKVGP